MTKNAEKHLAAAKDYIAKGDEYHRKAKGEIVAALEAGASQREVGRYLLKSPRWVRDVLAWDGEGTVWGHDTTDRQHRQAKQVLRESPPEQIAEELLSDPVIRAKVSQAQDIAHSNLEKKSREAERQALGEEVSDDLATQQVLRDAEAELFKARRALIETLRLLNQAAGTLTDSWREEFLRTFDDIAAKADLGRGLLVGALDDELEKILAEESR